jgi:hypothetical protein
MKEIIKIDRDSMVEHLIESAMEHTHMNPYSLAMYFKHGFKGYENYSDKELIEEYSEYISEDPNADIEIILEA